jgi:arginase family enzyme
MAQITITIPDEYLNDVIDAHCDHHNYNENKQEKESKAAFVERMLKQEMKERTVFYIRVRKENEAQSIYAEATALENQAKQDIQIT